MCASTTATIGSNSCGVDILAVRQHIIEQFQTTGRLEDMGTGGVMITHLCSRLAVAVEVEIHTDSTHSCQCGQSLLLIIAIT